MSIVSPSQAKKYNFVDFIFALFALTLIFMILVPANSSLYNAIRSALGDVENTRFPVSIHTEASFATDQEYWDTNCAYGWSSDSMCEEIVSRVQSCSISLDSAYCSQYANYLQTYLKN